MREDQPCNLLLLTLHLHIMANRFSCFPAITHRISFLGSHAFTLADISPTGALLSGSFFDCPPPFPRCWSDLNPVVTDCAVFVVCLTPNAASHLALLLSFPLAPPLLLRKAILQLRCNVHTQENSTGNFFPISGSSTLLYLLICFCLQFFWLGHILCPWSGLKTLATCSF